MKYWHQFLLGFAGSGSTLEACIRTGRRFIGVELDPHWAEVARERIRNAQPPLFAADAPGPRRDPQEAMELE